MNCCPFPRSRSAQIVNGSFHSHRAINSFMKSSRGMSLSKADVEVLFNRNFVCSFAQLIRDGKYEIIKNLVSRCFALDSHSSPRSFHLHLHFHLHLRVCLNETFSVVCFGTPSIHLSVPPRALLIHRGFSGFVCLSDSRRTTSRSFQELRECGSLISDFTSSVGSEEHSMTF